LGFRFVPASLYFKGEIVPGRSNKLHASITRDDIISRRDVVSIAEAAGYLGVSHKTIRRMIADGRLPAFRVGGSIRLYASDVEAAKIPVRA
jgi:excisionase family DNA binding protein